MYEVEVLQMAVACMFVWVGDRHFAMSDVHQVVVMAMAYPGGWGALYGISLLPLYIDKLRALRRPKFIVLNAVCSVSGSS